MKFTENNRISHRQLYRQMALTFLAPFLLCLPGEGALAGREGVVGILAALPLLAGYVILLMRMVPWYTDPVKNLGPVQGRLAGLLHGCRALRQRHLRGMLMPSGLSPRSV